MQKVRDIKGLQLVQVNALAAARLMAAEAKAGPKRAAELGEEEAAAEDGSAAKKRKTNPSLLQDERFGAMFEDPAFEIDPESEEYKILHPNAGQAPCTTPMLSLHSGPDLFAASRGAS